MAKPSRSAPSPQNRRGSPEAIEKRRVARLFSDILGGRAFGDDVLRSAGVLTGESTRKGHVRRRAA